MIEVVIIGQNEGVSVAKMIESIPSEWRIHYVADRCTDDTLEQLSEINNNQHGGLIDVVATIGKEGRQTSYCRNLGLSRCEKDSDVLFLDGDRYTVKGSLAEAIADCEKDLLLFPVAEDFRTPEMFQKAYGYVNNLFYSCGLFAKRKAIREVQVRQDGQFFNEELQGVWGIEDTSLGDLCYSLRLTAKLTDKAVLRGGFEKKEVDEWSTILKRFEYRNKLKYVRWA